MTGMTIHPALAMLRKRQRQRKRQKEFSLDNPVDPVNDPLMQIIKLSPNPEARHIKTDGQRRVRP
jgi:hypothetical protein